MLALTNHKYMTVHKHIMRKYVKKKRNVTKPPPFNVPRGWLYRLKKEI